MMNRISPLFRVATLILIMGAGLVAHAQEFRITRVELTPETTVLYYDLIDTVKARVYTINLYSSRDTYLSPLQKVKGDVGLEVRPGLNKRISWNSKEELGSQYSGNIELEVRGHVYIPFIRFEGFQEGQVIKRGKAKAITWSGGTRQNILNFTLYRGDGEYVDVIPNVANSGSYDLIIPTSVKPGNGYYFMVSDTRNKDQVMITNRFRVTRRIPLVVQALPLVVAAVVVPVVIGGTKPPPEKSNIDGPPGSPDNLN